MSSGSRSLLGTVFLISVLLAGAQQANSGEVTGTALQSDPRDPPTLTISFRDGLLSIEAKHGPWAKVLKEIRKKTGIRFHYTLALEGSVTLSFADLPVKEALERLFGPEANFVFRYQGAGDLLGSLALPNEVWVLGKVRGEGPESSKTLGGKTEGELSSPASNPRVDPGQTLEMTDRVQWHLVVPDEAPGEQEEIDKFLEMAQDDDPAIRARALSALSESGKADGGTIPSALVAALKDEDASVRGHAVQILAGRGGPEAMEHLWQALSDPDPYVRTMVVRTAVPNDQGIALLLAAGSDEDATVRSDAAFRLKEELQQ